MGFARLISLTCAFLQAYGGQSTKPKDLHMMAILPFSGERWPAGEAQFLAMNMALEQINQRADVLDGYRLHLVPGDDRVELELGKLRF